MDPDLNRRSFVQEDKLLRLAKLTRVHSAGTWLFMKLVYMRSRSYENEAARTNHPSMRGRGGRGNAARMQATSYQFSASNRAEREKPSSSDTISRRDRVRTTVNQPDEACNERLVVIGAGGATPDDVRMVILAGCP